MREVVYLDEMINNVIITEMELDGDNEQEVKLSDALTEFIYCIKSKYIAKGYRLGYEACSKKFSGGVQA